MTDITDNTLHLSPFIAASPLAVARLDMRGVVLECNESLREMVAQKMPDAGWKFLEIVSEENRTDVAALIARISAGQAVDKKPLEITLATSKAISALLYLSLIGAEAPQIIAQLIDTSEQKSLEQRFVHSQKMQAVGQLAGGIAHDFNNLLTAMIGFCDLLLMRHPAGDQSFADIIQVKQNANRAANLVRQLLAFSRRQTLQPKMLDITDVLAELSNLVRRLIGENIELKMIHGRDLGMVKADQGQLEQVFINLAVNARDAMTGGGRLTIQTKHITIDDKNAIERDLIPPVEDEAIVDGDYVLVEMIDTGTGIPRDLLQKIFEPFFSTKEVGSGTGLGLATVYGIIKQTGGYVYVSSTEGKGTKFCLFFKRYKQEAMQAVAAAPEQVTTDDLTGKGTVLLVEDETPVRTFAARALRNKGYSVLEADCGETAIEMMEKHGKEVDVIVTDVIMPGINGPTMIETIAPKFPQVKVIFISGYAEDVFVQSYGSEREFNFLAKPFTLKQLASKVKEVIQK
jgi:two-component system cell cycle sensor histidine kinase/response regulator CckA